jgi:serine/threonine-protein kinase
MTAPRDHWLEMERLFNEALGHDPATRTRWLAAACPDEALRAEVERLLAAEAGAEDRLRDVLAGAVPPAPIEKATRIGPYRLIHELGRGGMGSVWLAERADAEYVDRVAIKLIRADAASPGLIRRFLSERQILANLKHPNIARLLDGGTTDDGRPYLVMEYIEGDPIDVYCDRHRLSVADRIALVRQVAGALQFAHTNLVVHRDIKPSNILVTSDGAPRLLDFGIAKILDPATMPHRVAETGTGHRLMTPAYASPEQVRGDAVTTAADVYSIAVVLYELLTGRLPYRTESAQPHDLARLILEVQPEQPSTAVAADAPVERNTTLQRLRRQLEGDLDNILLVALRKEPERRYASIEQFAADLGRHLDGHPVVARPDTWPYRAGKFVKRNRGAVAAGMSTFLTLAFFALSVAIQANRIRRERDIANREREKAESVTAFLVDVFDAADPNNARGTEVTAREILAEGGRKAKTELADQPEVQAAAMETIGNVYRALGEYDSAAPFLQAAHDRRLAALGPNSLDYATSLTELGLLARILNRYNRPQGFPHVPR